MNLRQITLLVLAINVLPYWMCPGNSTRYIMPLCPLFLLVTTHIVLNFRPRVVDVCMKAG